MLNSRDRFEGPNLSSSRFVVWLVKTFSSLAYGFFHLICYQYDKAASKVVAKVSCNRQVRRGIQAERCSKTCSLATGLALIFASSVVLAQEPFYDIDIPSLNAAEALNKLAEQTGAVMLFPYDLAVARQAKAVVGRFTLTEALEALLDGSGLSSGRSDRRVVQISLEESMDVEQSEASVEAPINQGEPEMMSNDRVGFWKRLTASLGLAATAGIPAQAQVSDASAGVQMLEEVVVTARRREESLQDVPVAISVLNSDFIAQAGILDQFDLFDETPGMFYNQARDRNGARPAIRGVSVRQSQSLRLQKVSSFLDGAPVYGNTGSLSFADIERIEVMRGPQSSAFGRATFAGAINYVSKDPGDEFSSEFKLASSDLGRNVVGVSLNGPISDTLGFTFDAYFDEMEGPDEWVSSEGVRLGSTASDYITGKLVWAPSDNIEFKVRLSSLETDDGPPMEAFLSESARDACVAAANNSTLPNGDLIFAGEWNCDVASATPAGGVPQNLNPEESLTPGTPEYFLAQSFSVLDPGASLERNRIQAELNYSTDDGSMLQVLTSYSEDESIRWFDGDRSDAVPTFAMGMILGVDSMADPRTVEEAYFDVRWLSPDDRPVRWMVGASMYDFTHIVDVHTQLAGIQLGLEDEANGGQPFQPRASTNDEATNLGIYGNVTWDVTDATTLSFEGRWQDDDVTATSVLDGRTFNNVTESFQPRIAINHRLNEEWSLYGQYSQGTNPSGVNLAFRVPILADSLAAAGAAGFITYDEDTFVSYDEEELTNYEVGIKGSALDNRLQLSAALYLMAYEDAITRTVFNWNGAWNDGSFDPQGRVFGARDTRTGGTFINTGDQELKGIELEANYFANDNWSFRGTLTLSDNKFTDSCDQSPVGSGFPADFTVVDDGVPFDCTLINGNTVTRQPEETATVSATYRAALGGGGWQWSGRLGFRYQGSTYRDVMNIMQLPATEDVSASVTFSNENWELIVFGNNLTDVDTPQDIFVDEDPNISPLNDEQNYVLNFRLPREIGVRLNYRF
jgi:iron complex outermembrane receptor protein